MKGWIGPQIILSNKNKNEMENLICLIYKQFEIVYSNKNELLLMFNKAQSFPFFNIHFDIIDFNINKLDEIYLTLYLKITTIQFLPQTQISNPYIIATKWCQNEI